MKAREGRLPESCFHTSHAKGGGLKRTKFFFGARYLVVLLHPYNAALAHMPHGSCAAPTLLVATLAQPAHCLGTLP